MQEGKATVKKAELAVYVLFFSFGMIYITFLSRVVEIRHLLGDINPAQMGYILLCCSVGSVVFTPIAGSLLEKYSLRKFVRGSTIFLGIALSIFAISTTNGLYFFDMAIAVTMGAGFGIFNVTNNVAGVAVEKRAGRTMMPRFHSFFSLGAFAGTLVSQLVIHAGLAIVAQFIVVSISVAVVGFISAYYIYRGMPEEKVSSENGNIAKTASSHSPRIDKSLVMCGFIVMATTLCEGSGNDWISSGVVEGFMVDEKYGVSAMSVCLAFAAITRFFGNNLVDKFGRVAILRFGYVFAVAGVLIYSFTPILPLVYVAVAFWGFGVALGYPIGISAASDHPEHSAFRASIAATVGSVMNIAGPPLIGIIATSMGIRNALLVTVPLVIVAFFVADVVRERPQATQS